MLAIEETVITYTFIVLDKDRAAGMVSWDRSDTFTYKTPRVKATDEFAEWEKGLRGKVRIHTVEVDPKFIADGEAELFRRNKLLGFSAPYRDGDREFPTTLRRWKFIFSEETDAIMFKMKWL